MKNVYAPLNPAEYKAKDKKIIACPSSLPLLSRHVSINIKLMGSTLAQKEIIRCPVAAGVFYPEDMAEALAEIQAFCPDTAEKGKAQAIITPHGAWVISGPIAGAAFSAAAGRRGKITRVVILGPIHDRREEGLFLSTSHSFQTPLGMLAVDREISEQLEQAGQFLQINDIPHLGEHSIEILLPFVKYYFPEAAIIPILMGQPNMQMIDDLANSLKTVFLPIMENTLFVISCNLSIAGNHSQAKLMAEETLRLVYEKNGQELVCASLEGKINSCGVALVASLLKSGLLENRQPRFIGENIISAVEVEAEGNTVFFGAVSFE